MPLIDQIRAQLGRRDKRLDINDASIREALIPFLLSPVPKPWDLFDTLCLLVEEFGIATGKCRADISVFATGSGGPTITGMEIKSNQDSLSRLASQSAAYSEYFTHCWIVVGDKLIRPAVSALPRNWGILSVKRRMSGSLFFTTIRPAHSGEVDFYKWLDLLFREEVLDIFRSYSVQSNITRRPKDYLVQFWRELFSPEQTRKLVWDTLVNRSDWRRRELATLHRPSRS